MPAGGIAPPALRDVQGVGLLTFRLFRCTLLPSREAHRHESPSFLTTNCLALLVHSAKGPAASSIAGWPTTLFPCVSFLVRLWRGAGVAEPVAGWRDEVEHVALDGAPGFLRRVLHLRAAWKRGWSTAWTDSSRFTRAGGVKATYYSCLPESPCILSLVIASD